VIARLVLAVLTAAAVLAQQRQPPAAPAAPSRADILTAMKRATVFMADTVSLNGGYVWAYLPDLSRRWGEIEARPTMLWMQPPGTATMGHLFLDAYHATGDEYYYQAAERTAAAVVWSQLPVGGWNYVADMAGEASLRQWYGTVGKNAWRLEEFQHYWGNGTFDDVTTIDAARLLLRMYLEKRDPKYRPPLDKALAFVLDSQYPIGGWPQRYPARPDFIPDYTSFITFNDDVAAENIDFLLQCYQTLGDGRLVDPILRGMNAFIVLQQGPPQAGWALQYSLDYKPAGARTYEPNAIVTHTTARNVELLIRFYRLTGDTKFLARVPEAIDWLASVTSPAGVAPKGRTHPTFVEVGTNQPLYVHREGSNVVNGRYYVDRNPAKTLGHYGSFRNVNRAGLRQQYQDARALAPADAAKGSPLVDPKAAPLPKFFALDPAATEPVAEVIASLDARGAWIAPLEYVSHPYRGDGPATPPAGDFSTTHVGDEFDTSPFLNTTVTGISTATYIRRMTVLIKALGAVPTSAPSPSPSSAPVTWRFDNPATIGGHTVSVQGTPRVVATPAGLAVEFNGRTDGLVVDANPIQGLRAFTIEAEFSPAADAGPEHAEQRFVHVEESDTGNRALLEIRLLGGPRWALDSFLRSGATGVTLLDRARSHPTGDWHVAALVYDGSSMTHYVDGVAEGSAAATFVPLAAGRTAIGMRLNQVSWFKGRVRQIRVSPEALPANRLLRAR
jgi:PelA/Pel-15E family pectate lyase